MSNVKNDEIIIEADVIDEEVIEDNDSKEIVESKNEQKGKFRRVDFNDLQSINNYGSEAINGIIEVLDKSTKLADGRPEVSVSEKQLNKIVSFSEDLDKSKKKNNNTSLVVSGVNKVLSTLGFKKTIDQSEKRSYKAQYEKYCENLSEIRDAILSQQKASLFDIDLRKAIVSEMKPYIELLKEIIEFGYLDKEEYDKETESLKGTFSEEAIQYRNTISTLFESKLNNLDKMRVTYEATIYGYNLQNATDMQLVMSHENYLKHTQPLLKVQGSLAVFNCEQEDRLNTMNNLNAAMNEAIAKNSKELSANVASAANLSLNDGISMDTIDTFVESLHAGVDTIRETRAKRAQLLKDQAEALKKISESLDEFGKEVVQIDEPLLIGSNKSLKLGNGNKRS